MASSATVKILSISLEWCLTIYFKYDGFAFKIEDTKTCLLIIYPTWSAVSTVSPLSPWVIWNNENHLLFFPYTSSEKSVSLKITNNDVDSSLFS